MIQALETQFAEITDWLHTNTDKRGTTDIGKRLWRTRNSIRLSMPEPQRQNKKSNSCSG